MRGGNKKGLSKNNFVLNPLGDSIFYEVCFGRNQNDLLFSTTMRQHPKAAAARKQPIVCTSEKSLWLQLLPFSSSFVRFNYKQNPIY